MKKAGKIAVRIVSILILLFAVFIMVFTIISVSTVNKDEADFMGYKPFIVLSDSMQEDFEVGDMVVSKEVDPATLKEGDIITFKSIDPANYGGVMTHKIREITTYEDELAFITYGTTTGADDAYPVPADNVIGKYMFKLPNMGYFFEFLKSTAGYFLLIFTPFMILIILQAVKFFRLLKRYRAEQNAVMEEQKKRLEDEQRRSRMMEEELKRLRNQIQGENAGRNATQSGQAYISSQPGEIRQSRNTNNEFARIESRKTARQTHAEEVPVTQVSEHRVPVVQEKMTNAVCTEESVKKKASIEEQKLQQEIRNDDIEDDMIRKLKAEVERLRMLEEELKRKK